MRILESFVIATHGMSFGRVIWGCYPGVSLGGVVYNSSQCKQDTQLSIVFV